MSSAPPTVLITGANQGIGFFVAQLLSQSEKPYTILVGARDATRGEEAVSKLASTKTNSASTISTLAIDINDADGLKSAAAEVESRYGCLDILVNNAAIGSVNNDPTNGDLRSTWQAVFDTNIMGTVHCTYAFLPLLQKSADGKIIVMSSSVGSITMAEAAPSHPLVTTASAYRASKAALNMVIVQWAKNLKNVRVWGVDPGLCATGFAGDYSRSRGRDPKEGADIVRQCIEGEREDTVGKVVWEEDGETGVRPW